MAVTISGRMTVVLTLIVLSVLILVHEFGHFLFARIFGVRVLTFSVGFGPKIAGKWWGDTEFIFSALPLGGYVRMLGDDPRDQRWMNFPGSFLAKPVWQRALIVLAGPLFNFLLGFLLLFIIAWRIGVPYYAGNQVEVVAEGSPADSLGIQTGARIVAVDERPVTSWFEISEILWKEGDHTLTLVQEGDTFRLRFPEGKSLQDLGLAPLILPVVGGVARGTPAARLGLQPGDTLVAVAGRRVQTWGDVVEIIQNHPGDTLEVVWRRNGQVMRGIVVPEAAPDIRNGKEVTIGRIGVMSLQANYRLSFLESLSYATSRSIRAAQLIFWILYKLLRRDVSIRTLGGPIMIGKAIGESMGFGLFNLLGLVALISINLTVINLLPIPALDGGHLLVYLVEVVRRKPLSPETQATIQKIGFALLIGLMVLIVILDILRVVR